MNVGFVGGMKAMIMINNILNFDFILSFILKKMITIEEARKKNGGWLRDIGKCEVCNTHLAEYNLDLRSGSHRECRWCWCTEDDYDFS